MWLARRVRCVPWSPAAETERTHVCLDSLLATLSAINTDSNVPLKTGQSQRLMSKYKIGN